MKRYSFEFLVAVFITTSILAAALFSSKNAPFIYQGF